MNGQKFHLLDATVDLFDPSEINSDSRNSDVKPLFLRVIPAVRAYFQGTLALVGGRRPRPKGLHYQAGINDPGGAYEAGDF
jgi:hypothetical protein